MNALIIEDELHAQNDLARLLKKVDPNITVLGTLESVEDSVQWFDENADPDLIFMDIQLADALSFEIFERVEVRAAIIFTTAFEDYAIRAFKVNSIDYLLKPIEESELIASLKKFRELKDHFTSGAQISAIGLDELKRLAGRRYKRRFITKIGDRIQHIPIEAVAYFFSNQDYTYLVTIEDRKYIIEYTLEELREVLDPHDFFRVSRKYIAQISSIESVTKHFNSRLRVKLKPPTVDDILISRARVPEFLNWLEK